MKSDKPPIAALLALAALGSFTLVTAQEPKTTGGEKEITNSIGMKLVYCPSGSFKMGSPVVEGSRSAPNEAQVSVTISKGFYLGKFSVTQSEFKSVMGTTPWAGKDYVKEGDDYPATYVDWNDATEFCRKLTAMESQAGRLPQGYVYALPTEAQREYACRAGTTTAYSFGDDAKNLGDYAWWGGNVGKTEQYAHRVGQKKPNPWGLYDMHGNVWEWCRDAYTEKLPGGTDPLVETGSVRVIRGGGWGGSTDPRNWRSANRNHSCAPGTRDSHLGFRASLVPADKQGERAESVHSPS